MSKLKEVFLLRLAFPTADFVMGTKAMKWYKQLNQMEKWSPAEIDAWQLENLKSLIHHVYNHTVYYREVFDNLKLKPEDIQSFDDLKKLPILTKNIIRQRFDDICSDVKIKTRKSSTGGTTGEPFKFLVDENSWGIITAGKIKAWKTTGYRYGDMFLSLGSRSLFPVNKKSLIHEIYFRLRNTIPLNGMNMDDENCENFVQLIKKHNIKYIYGFASPIYLLALYCKRKNDNIKIDCAFSTAEKLTPQYREVIESTWNGRVMDCYGSRDGGMTAYEINPGRYNVTYNAYCETKEEGKASELFCTNLVERAFPLIRYQGGDDILLASENEKMDYNGQVIKEVIGRTPDIMYFGNGHKLTFGGFNTLLRDFTCIKAFRLIKKDDFALKIQLQKNEQYMEQDEDLIIQTTKKYTGAEVEVIIEYVDEFKPLENGKRSFFMNETE